jgi:hypothetical protein
MWNSPELFHRPELAQKLAKQVLMAGVGSAASSGVFLASPRRTGKSTFIREDLRPAFEAEGVISLTGSARKSIFPSSWTPRKFGLCSSRPDTGRNC